MLIITLCLREAMSRLFLKVIFRKEEHDKFLSCVQNTNYKHEILLMQLVFILYCNTYKVFVGLTGFLKVTGEFEELCKVAGIFCELHKGCCKTHKFFIKLLANSINFIKLLANSTNFVKLFASFTNFVKCFTTSTNFSKLFVASRNFVKGCFLQN